LCDRPCRGRRPDLPAGVRPPLGTTYRARFRNRFQRQFRNQLCIDTGVTGAQHRGRESALRSGAPYGHQPLVWVSVPTIRSVLEEHCDILSIRLCHAAHARQTSDRRACGAGRGRWTDLPRAHRVQGVSGELRHHQPGVQPVGDGDGVVGGERRNPGVVGRGRQRRDPLVLAILGPAVAAGRPGVDPDDLPGGAELGQGLPDPDLQTTLRTGRRSTPPPPAPAASRR